MGINRFKTLLSLIWQYRHVDFSDVDASDPARFIAPIESDFNAHYADTVLPGSSIMMDESMSFYYGQTGNPNASNPPNPKLLFHQNYVPRKPRDTGKEIKDLADVSSKMILAIEAQRGKVLHVDQEYYEDFGHTIAQTLRLTKAWHHSGRMLAADSWFSGVTAVEVLRDFGLYMYGDVKTNSSRYPVAYIQEKCGNEPGDWITLRSTDSKGRLLLAIGHRRGPAVHTYICSRRTAPRCSASRRRTRRRSPRWAARACHANAPRLSTTTRRRSPSLTPTTGPARRCSRSRRRSARTRSRRASR
jgi:hypothetical protein